MSSRVYVDTSFLYTMVDLSAPDHVAAEALREQHRDGLNLSTYVLADTMSLPTKRFDKSLAMRTARGIVSADVAHLIYPTRSDFAAARDLFAQYPNWDFDLVNAFSFALMRREGIETALTFDRHFAQMGFVAFPASAPPASAPLGVSHSCR